MTYLLGNGDLEAVFDHGNEGFLARGVEHALLDTALEPRTGVDENCITWESCGNELAAKHNFTHYEAKNVFCLRCLCNYQGCTNLAPFVCVVLCVCVCVCVCVYGMSSTRIDIAKN